MREPQEKNVELKERLQTHVDRLAGLIGPRHLGKPEMLEATARLIEGELADSGYTTHREPYVVHGVEVANIVAEKLGESPDSGLLVVGAHYDTVETTPGADDNASGVAVMLEVARLLRDKSLIRKVRFVAFPCEEPPYFHTDDMGSQFHARACRQRSEQIVGMICLEMLGYFTDEPNSQKMPPGVPGWLRWAFPRRGRFLAAVGNLRSWRLLWSFRRGFKKAARVPLYSIALPEVINAIRLSDNSSFWDQGYPAVMVTDTSFLRNPHYHLPTDTPETLDYARMAEATKGIAGAIAWMSGGRK